MNERPDWPPATGEMAERIRAHDWAATPLGPVEDWPAELKLATSLVLENRFPAALIWGPGYVTLYNDAFRPILGAKPEALGRSFADIWREAWHEIGPMVDRAFAGESTFIEDYPLVIDRSGELEQAYFTFSYSPVRAADGSVAGMIDTVVETTGKVRAGQALRESEERFRLIVENATDYAIFFTDPDGIITDWLPGAEAVFGWTAEEAIGRPSDIAFTPEDQAEGVPDEEIATAAGEGIAADVRWHQRKDGSHVFIQGAVTPLWNEDGSIRGYLKIGQDLSERRAAQEALEASERRMRLLATGIPQLVFRSEGDGHRTWGSPQWIEYTGLSFEESLGLGWLDKVHPDDRQTTMDAWMSKADDDEYYVEHRICEAATGEWRWHQTRAIPLRSDDGRIVEWLGTSTDVEEMRQLQRHQQILLGELQHRVRNTLGVVRSIARRTAETSATTEEMASHLAGRLDAFSRVQSMATRNPEGGIDLAALIEDELRAHAAREGEHLTITGPVVCLKAKRAETMSLAIHELATNSVKYGALSDDGRITISWERRRRDDGEWLALDWSESGVELAGREPEREGFGLELLKRTLPYDLDAETKVEFRPQGLRFTLAMPLRDDALAE